MHQHGGSGERDEQQGLDEARGTGLQTTLNELREQYGIAVYPIVTVRQIIDMMHNQEVDGKVIIDDEMKGRMEAYLAEYGGK